MASKPESTRQFLNNALFLDIRQRIETHARLLKKIKESLPAPMAERCLYCVAREDGSLVIYTDSQAFASQLRFHAPSILARLEAAGETTFKQIAIRNLSSVEPAAASKPETPMKKPSPKAIAAVKASSRATGDELDAALARLGASMERYAENKP